jgi:hypothetical protein
MNAPRTAAQVWEKLVEEAGEDEIEAASRMTEAEAEAYLAEQGFDVEAERQKGEDFLAALEGRSAAAGEAPRVVQAATRARPERRTLGVSAGWMATVATAALGVTAATAAVLATPHAPADIEPDRPAPPQVSPAVAQATELRDRAKNKLDEWLPEQCLLLLDQAAQKDPKGDQAPEIVEMRATATERMQVGPKR